MKLKLLSIFLFVSVVLFAQEKQDSTVFVLAADDPVLATIDSMMASGYFESLGFNDNVGELNVNNYHKDSVPVFDSLTYAARFEELNKNSPFSIVYNTYITGYVNMYAKRRKKNNCKNARISTYLFPYI